MKTQIENTQKRHYVRPELSLIKLDNEISLALESFPPVLPGEEDLSKTSEYFNHNPFEPRVS